VDKQGTVYVDSIRGVPTGFDLQRWSPVVDPPANGDGTYPFQYKGRPDGCGVLATGCDFAGIAEGGGDADMAVNFPASGVPNLALSSLLLVPGITVNHSTDRGESFSQPNPVGALIPGDDREWMDGIDAQTVYLSYHDLGTFEINVQRSTDGGQFYTNGFGQAIDAATFPAAGGAPGSANLLGPIRVDNSACPSRGNLYQIFVAPDNLMENVNNGPLRSVYVGVSRNAKRGQPVYTFTDHKIFPSPLNSLGGTNGTANIFPAFAVDDFGFVYAVWSDNSNILFSSSGDQGTTWRTSPILINQGATVGSANVFPWIAADANGHVGIVWFGADRAGNSNARAVMEPGHPARQGAACDDGTITCMQKWANWNVYYAESVNAHAAAPVFAQNVISDHVIHRGTVSTGGLGGGADRSLADFFQVAFDPQHGANVAFSDDHKVSLAGSNNGADNPTTRRHIRANFTHQTLPNPGIVQTGSCAAAPPQEREDEGEGEDDNHDNFAFADNPDRNDGVLIFNDPTQGVNLRSSNGVRSISYSANGTCVSFIGNAKVNDKVGYQFSFTACDLSAMGGIGTFSISLTGPAGFTYQKSAPITRGFVKLNQML
jgi:hypothetical protein